MDPEKLVKDELQYELKLRGFVELQGETAKSMRQKLGEILRNEAFGSFIEWSEDVPMDAIDEVEVCVSKVESLENYVVKMYKVSGNKSIIGHIESKLKHLFGRLARLQHKLPHTEDHRETLRAITNLVERLEKVEEKVYNIDVEENTQQEEVMVQIPELLATSGPRATTTSIVNIHKHQYEPRKWGIRFSGTEGLSVSAFLEQIEVRRRSSNFSQAEVLPCLPDLLEGGAAIWFQANIDKIKTWSDFQQMLREEFQPCFYQSELWAEIRARRQGDQERVGIYFAYMAHLFTRLPTPPTEEEKLEVLNRNILPFYIENLGLASYNSVAELEKLLKRLEKNKEIAEKRRSSLPQSRSLLEPDLADQSRPAESYVNRRSRPQVMSIENEKTCWNCNRVGHTFRFCRERRFRKFCFRCGLQGVTKYECSRCSGNEGGNEPSGARSGQHQAR